MIGKEQIHKILSAAVSYNASDIHLSEGYPPVLRIEGRLQAMKTQTFSRTDMEDIVVQLLDDVQMDRFRDEKELDFAYHLEGVAHFRVNLFSKMGGFACAFRIIPARIRSLQELGMPDSVVGLARAMEGLILVTGPTGHGKSTTIASMIDLINTERKSHIITIEDPIEYTHSPKGCMIHQRGIGYHTHTFSAALRSALREDPDIIMVGEMRDLETISLALTAAETGHLVLSTVHTRNAPDTITRIIDVFPTERQSQILAQISSSLIGVISQRLLPDKSGKGRIAAVEIMLVTAAIRNLIRERKIHQIRSVMQSSSALGLQTLDDHMLQLLGSGKVDRATVMKYCHEQDRFSSKGDKEQSPFKKSVNPMNPISQMQ